MFEVDKDKVIRFRSHDLSVDVFSAGDVHIGYGSKSASHDLFLNRVSVPKPVGWDERRPSGRSGPYPAFAGPLNVRWRSLDHMEHRCELDLAELMPECKIMPPAHMDEIYWEQPLLDQEPLIIVEIVDRKLSLYLYASFRRRSDSLGLHKGRFIQHKTMVYSKEF